MANVVKTGEAPGKGKYHCTNCDQMIELSSGDTMPPCPRCSNTEFTR